MVNYSYFTVYYYFIDAAPSCKSLLEEVYLEDNNTVFAGYTSKFSSFTWGSSIFPNLPVSWQMRVDVGYSYLLKSQRIGED